MKKLITILAIMIVLVGAVFAASGDKIVLSSTVAKVSPNFKIYLDSNVGTPTGTEVSITEDISEEDVTRTFTLKQSGDIRVKDNQELTYSKFKGTATLTVKIGKFKGTVNNVAKEQSSDYSITSATKG